MTRCTFFSITCFSVAGVSTASAICLSGSAGACAAAWGSVIPLTGCVAAGEPGRTLTILHVNDLHARLSPDEHGRGEPPPHLRSPPRAGNKPSKFENPREKPPT